MSNKIKINKNLKSSVHLMTRCLKVLIEAACLQLAERLFQSFTPQNEKHFLPFSVPFFGNLRSVDVLRILYDVLCEFFLNKLRKYGGASSFKLLSQQGFY